MTSPSSPPERTEELVELKPCPFCGGEAVFTGSLVEPPKNHVTCTSCPAVTRAMMGREAGAAWNARAALQSLGYAEMERENARLKEFAQSLRYRDDSIGDKARAALTIEETDYSGWVDVPEEGEK